MKVYRVSNDVAFFQQIAPASGYWKDHLDDFDCSSLAEEWIAPKVRCQDRRKKSGDFFHFTVGTLGVAPRALARVSPFWKLAGEILPVLYNGEEYSLLNVTVCLDCLDYDRCEWLIDEETGKRALLRQYAFLPDRFSHSSLFKVRETCRGHILTYERSGDPKEEFKAFVEAEGLTGLQFQEVWNSDDASSTS